MDALKAVIGAKRKQAQEELGGRKFAKRSLMEIARLTQLREEEEKERAELVSISFHVGLCTFSCAVGHKLPLEGASEVQLWRWALPQPSIRPSPCCRRRMCECLCWLLLRMAVSGNDVPQL